MGLIEKLSVCLRLAQPNWGHWSLKLHLLKGQYWL